MTKQIPNLIKSKQSRLSYSVTKINNSLESVNQNLKNMELILNKHK